MADKTKSGTTEGHHKHKPPVPPVPPATPVPPVPPGSDPVDIAVNAAIAQAYAFSDTPQAPDASALSTNAAKQLEQLLTNLIAQAVPDHDKKAGAVPPDNQFRIQRSKDQSDATTALDSAIANAKLEWTQAGIAWNQAISAYAFQRDSAEFALHSAVQDAKNVYQPTMAATVQTGSGGTARYMTFKLAVAEAIEAFLAAIAAAASARGAAEGALRSAYIELVTAIYAAQGTEQTAMVTAEQTFWQNCQAGDG